MHLAELLKQHEQPPAHSVPDWILGCFQRRSITFANGLIDTQTLVFWLQSRTITIDLRLPIAAEQVSAKALEHCDERELRTLANYEGWYAESLWQDNWLTWSGGTSFQIHNRWPEPGSLVRVGDCMMEFSPNASYIEDWRIQSRQSGPLIGLRLIDEEDLDTGCIRHRDGALIVNGNWAGLVLGRATEYSSDDIDGCPGEPQLRDLVCAEQRSAKSLQDIFNFETSVASGDMASGFLVCHSTRAERVGQTLFALDGFEFDIKSNEISHIFEANGSKLKRRFTIDAFELSFPFSAGTALSKSTEAWFDAERETLARYLKVWKPQ